MRALGIVGGPLVFQPYGWPCGGTSFLCGKEVPSGCGGGS